MHNVPELVVTCKECVVAECIFQPFGNGVCNLIGGALYTQLLVIKPPKVSAHDLATTQPVNKPD